MQPEMPEASGVTDSRNEYDKGAFDTVTKATANHGLHIGKFSVYGSD